MAALIKNALIKQLSKYLKNVTSNQINISTLKGEGEMTNIQLDENVLMDLIELPLWLKITSARCNKVSVKIPWTKLKTSPILIQLDKIDLEMEIANPLRQYKQFNDKIAIESVGTYGFIDKCIDAIQLNIDSVNITIKSNEFNANLNISNICVYSATPNWKPTNDIRNTRLKDLEKEEIILYKIISWEICRLEAYNIDSNSTVQNATSIKLIMNPSQMQIALKKKLSDKSLINSTVRVLLNEIYWMANDIQLKSAIKTYNTLSKLMKKAFAQKIKYANYQLQMSQNKSKNGQQLPQLSPNHKSQPNEPDTSKVFLQHDIKETSLHLLISNLIIHLYADDNYSGNKLIDGGAMQVLFKNVCIDHYPYHKIGSSTTHWNNYNFTFKQREDWSNNILKEFIGKLETIVNKCDLDVNKISVKNNINLMETCTIVTLQDLCLFKVTTNMSDKSANTTSAKVKKATNQNDKKSETAPPMDSPNDFLKKDTYFIEQQVFDKRPFLSSNYSEFNLPSETLFANIMFSEFYFPEDCNFPTPAPQIFVQLSPILVNVDFLTLLWVNTLLFSLWREKLVVDEATTKSSTITAKSSVKSSTGKQQQQRIEDEATPFVKNLHCDTYVELITPKIALSIYPTKKLDYENSNAFVKRPTSIEIGFARVCLTNASNTACRSATLAGKLNAKKFSTFKNTTEKCYDLMKSLKSKNVKFAQWESNTEPNPNGEIRFNSLAPCFDEMLKNENLVYYRYDLSFDDDLTKLINTTNKAASPKDGLFLKSLNKSTLNKNAAKDVWSIEIESMWVDFKDHIDNQTSTFIENTNFIFYLVNVWDFYCEQVPAETMKKSHHQRDTANFRKACDRLAKLIRIHNTSSGGEFDDEPEVFSTKPKSGRKRRSKSISFETTDSCKSLCKSFYSQLNVIGEIKKLRITTNHSQILFLLRLLDTIDVFTNQMKVDTEHTLKHKTQNTIDEDSNKSKKKFMIKSINLDNLDQLDENACFHENVERDNQASVNLALAIDDVEIDLIVNDLRKTKLETLGQKLQNKLTNLIDPDDDENENQENETKRDAKDKDSVMLALEKLTDDKQHKLKPAETLGELNKEFMTSYIKYIYGLSNENPNQQLKFQSRLNTLNVHSLSSSDSGIVNMSDRSSSLSLSFTSTKSRTSSVVKFQASSNENDLNLDDGDTISLLASLDTDDTASLINYDISSDQVSISKEQDLSRSVSEMSLLTSSLKQTTNQTESTSSFSSQQQLQQQQQQPSPQATTPPQMSEKHTQTDQCSLSVKVKLKNLATYVQTQGDNLGLIARLEQITLQDKKSKQNAEILIRFKKLLDDGLVELLVENLKLDAHMFILAALAELVDDEDNFCLTNEPKPQMPVNILVKSSQFNLSDDANVVRFEHDPKLLSIIIEKAIVHKLPNNQLVIREIKLAPDRDHLILSKRKNLSTNGNLAREIEYLNQFKYDLTFLEFNSKFKFNSDKFASLVFQLKKSRHDYVKLEDEHRNRKFELDMAKDELSRFQSENVQLREEIERLKKRETSVVANGYVPTDDANKDLLLEKYKLEHEIERKQFETLLRACQEENEFLKSKLNKSEDQICLLTREKERSMSMKK